MAMKKLYIFTAWVIISGCGVFAALAQRGPGGGAGRIYNPQTVETITGEVVKVEKVSPMGGMGPGVHLLVRTNSNSEPMPVHLGPNWFIENQELQIQPKDQVQVTGSRIELAGQPALIASEVTKDGEVLKLRDDTGRPVWAAWRQRGMGGAGMGAPGMGRGMRSQDMAGRRQQMMAEHQRFMDQMKAMDEQLDQKAAQMNQAQGDAKVEAMADLLNQLVRERKTMRQHMETMRAQMMSPAPAGPGMGAPSSDLNGSDSSSSQSETDKE